MEEDKAWFTTGTVFQDSLAKTIAYLPVGDLPILLSYQKRFLPYKSDVDKDGKYDKLKEYQGAELTILQKGDDCEGLAGFFSEVIRQWFGWESWHVRFIFIDDRDGETKGHDVAFFKRPNGSIGWIEASPTQESNSGRIHDGGYRAFEEFYPSIGWQIEEYWTVNDIGERI